MNPLKKVLSIAAIATFTCFAIASGSDKKEGDAKKTDSTSKATGTEAATAQSTGTGNWTYQEEENKMSDKPKKIASIDAKEELQFEFPYNGGSIASFVIRQNDGATNTYLHVSKGQFMTTLNGGIVRIKFDDAQPKKYSFSHPSDGSTETIFINAAKEVIQKLKTSKKMIVEAEFFNEGIRQIEFDTEGLKWE